MTQVAFIAPEYLNRNRIFDISMGRDGGLERFAILWSQLKRSGIQCDTFDICGSAPVDILICLDAASSIRQLLKAIRVNPLVKIVYTASGEPPVMSCLHENHILAAMPFDRIAYWQDDFVRQCDRGVKCNMGQPVIAPDSVSIIPFQQKKFLVAITSSKLVKHKNCIHQERFDAFDFFSRKPEGIDLYGMGWDGMSYPFVKTSYKGTCETKKDVLLGYKFSICFENSLVMGYISEKIFDCFAAGVVPIYYGAPNVQDYIPKECFIDFRDFRSYEELYQLLTTMTEVEYQSYLDAVKAFIATPEYYEFTSMRYAEIVLEQIQSVMNESKLNRTVLDFKWPLFRIAFSHPVLFLKNLKQCRRFLFDLLMVW